MKKIISALVAAILMLSIVTSNLSAHNMDDCGYEHSVDTTFWDIYESSVHWGSYKTTITVDCGIFEGHDFETYINNAVSKWDQTKFNGSDLLSMKADNSSGSVLFRNFGTDQMNATFGYSAWAITYRDKAVKDSSGFPHYSTAPGSIEIWVNWNDVLVNKSATAKTHVSLHELGHVIGLVDIPNTVSTNSYLMCNEFGNNPAPTAISHADLQGAAVILGQHTSHSFSYSTYSSSQHKKYCTICGIYKYEAHSYNGTTCIYCKRSKS